MSYSKITFPVLAGVLIFLMVAGGSYLLMGPAGEKTSHVAFAVEKGIPLKMVASRLKKEGLIRNETAFVFYGRFSGATQRIQEGVYRVSPGDSSPKILRMMVKGEIWTQRFTIPEGFTARDIANKLDAEKVGSGRVFLDLVQRGAARGEFKNKFLKDFRIANLEGYLFPDTYEYLGERLSEKELIEKMLARFEEKVLPLWEKRPAGYPFSLKDAVKVASIIEREARKGEEREVIAGVFVNRLNRGMRLESCASVDYALGRHSTGVLTFKDIEVNSPYNTYRYYGLPPGPISNPGLASIKAALNYERNGYLYFVARGDGGHIFTSTFAEHLQAQRMVEGR